MHLQRIVVHFERLHTSTMENAKHKYLSRQAPWEKSRIVCPYFIYRISVHHCWWSRLRSSHPSDPKQLLCNPSCKKHHPQTASCCLRVGRRPPWSQSHQSEVPHSAERVTWGRGFPPRAEEPGVPRRCCCRSDCGWCTGAGGCWCSHHPSGTEARDGFAKLRRDKSIFDNGSVAQRKVVYWSIGGDMYIPFFSLLGAPYTFQIFVCVTHWNI